MEPGKLLLTSPQLLTVSTNFTYASTHLTSVTQETQVLNCVNQHDWTWCMNTDSWHTLTTILFQVTQAHTDNQYWQPVLELNVTACRDPLQNWSTLVNGWQQCHQYGVLQTNMLVKEAYLAWPLVNQVSWNDYSSYFYSAYVKFHSLVHLLNFKKKTTRRCIIALLYGSNVIIDFSHKENTSP